MNVLGVFPTYRPSSYSGSVGGGEISNRILFEGLAKCGYDVSVITLCGTGDKKSVINGVTVFDVCGGNSKFSRLFSSVFFRREAKIVAGTLKVDMIVSTTEAVPTALFLGDQLGVPVGVVIRALENFDSKEKSLKKILKRFVKSLIYGSYGEQSLRKSNFLLPNSEFIRSICADRIPSIPSRVVYPPINIEISTFRRDIEVKTVVMVGSGPHKGTSLTYKLAEAFPDLNFRIVGVPKIPIGEEVREGNVTSVGWCDIQKEFQCRADLVIVPSICEEAFGRVAIEALAAGKLVLASNIGGLSEAVNNEEQLLLPPDDLNAWKECVGKVVMYPGHYLEVCERAGGNLDKFSLNTQIRAFREALEDFSVK